MSEKKKQQWMNEGKMNDWIDIRKSNVKILQIRLVHAMY